MEHVYGIVGGTLGLVGGLVLAVDLWMSNTREESTAEFKRIQDQFDLGTRNLSLELAMNMRNLSQYLVKYFMLLERDLPETSPASQARASLANTFMSELDEQARGAQVIATVASIEGARSELEERFMAEVARSQRMRRIALIGVILVAVGAALEIADRLYGS